jgi:RNA polymerase sigma-B factor
VSSSTEEQARYLFTEYERTRDPRLRDALVELYQPLVRYLAGKFAARGEPLEDLIQVANIGLINAVNRFDPSAGTKFPTFATPTVVGEIRRYFRDRAWSVKVPRRLQELHQSAARAADALCGRLGRSPTHREIADYLGATEEETLAAIELGGVYESLSLDALVSVDMDANPLTVAEFIGERDATLTRLERYGDLDAALGELEEREREVIVLRFFRELSQAEVARRLDISQMHVSRLQSRALYRLRKHLNAARRAEEETA